MSTVRKGRAHLQIEPKTRSNYLNRHINYCSNFSRRKSRLCALNEVNGLYVCGHFSPQTENGSIISFLHPFSALYNFYTEYSILSTQINYIFFLRLVVKDFNNNEKKLILVQSIISHKNEKKNFLIFINVYFIYNVMFIYKSLIRSRYTYLLR